MSLIAFFLFFEGERGLEELAVKNLSCLCCSYFWGVLADHKGRKPVIIISGVFVALSSLSFGFSVNLAMAIISRFFMGFFNGK